jgi:hypothetical protein
MEYGRGHGPLDLWASYSVKPSRKLSSTQAFKIWLLLW